MYERGDRPVPSTRHRATPKQELLLKQLRTAIAHGRWQPNQQLPSQPELATMFRVSTVTVQLALHRLAHDGVVVIHQRRGVFVSDRPPHLSQYALVFWHDPRWPWLRSKFFSTLSAAARTVGAERALRVQEFYGIDQHTDTEDYQRLLDWVQARQLGGLIFANVPFMLGGSPLLEQTDVPLVAFTNNWDLPHGMIVDFGPGWIERACAELARQGRRRVAVLEATTDEMDDTPIAAIAAQYGLECPEEWRQVVSHRLPLSAQRVTQLLLRAAPSERPDALLVMDDNLVEQTVAGLLRAGVRVPDDVLVIAHANFPLATAAALPCLRLGYDLRVGVRLALQLIEQRRQSPSSPRCAVMPVVWESEVSDAECHGAGGVS